MRDRMMRTADALFGKLAPTGTDERFRQANAVLAAVDAYDKGRRDGLTAAAKIARYWHSGEALGRRTNEYRISGIHPRCQETVALGIAQEIEAAAKRPAKGKRKE